MRKLYDWWFRKQWVFPLAMWVMIIGLLITGGIKTVGNEYVGIIVEFLFLAVTGGFTVILVWWDQARRNHRERTIRVALESEEGRRKLARAMIDGVKKK